MSIIGWLILGLIAGFIASKIVNKTGEGLIIDIVLGIIGAVVGGFLFSLVGASPVTGDEHLQHGGRRDWSDRRPPYLPRGHWSRPDSPLAAAERLR